VGLLQRVYLAFSDTEITTTTTNLSVQAKYTIWEPENVDDLLLKTLMKKNWMMKKTVAATVFKKLLLKALAKKRSS
jgi:hypothetical protein